MVHLARNDVLSSFVPAQYAFSEKSLCIAVPTILQRRKEVQTRVCQDSRNLYSHSSCLLYITRPATLRASYTYTAQPKHSRARGREILGAHNSASRSTFPLTVLPFGPSFPARRLSFSIYLFLSLSLHSRAAAVRLMADRQEVPCRGSAPATLRCKRQFGFEP